MLRFLEKFLKMESSSGLLLAGATIVAMLLANFSSAYFPILEAKFFGLSVHHWVNDGLMTLFFFVVGMEIKRELLVGELASRKKAFLPMAAALGGMLGPALIYYFFNPNYPGSRGWGIPMATDIAFAVGVLSFFRIPLSLKIFLLALAIVDDLGAVLVIALFYTKEIFYPFLLLAAAGLCLFYFLFPTKLRPLCFALGALVWFAILKSGVHATVAGVLLGFLVPLKISQEEVLESYIHKLHPWVSFGVMPVFALCNAGVFLRGIDYAALGGDSVFQGVAAGLVLGKPLGICALTALTIGIRLGELPTGVRWPQLIAVSFLAGIGFTMALFISGLALYPEQEIFSKTAILAGSVVSACLGSALLLKSKA